MEIDTNYIYLAGHDATTTNFEYRVEKRNISTGALCDGVGNCAAGAFDTDGAVQVNPAADADWYTDIDIDSSYVYLGGFVDDDSGSWRTEKRDIADGSLVTAFDDDGISTNEDGGDDRVTAISVNGSNVFLAGYGTGPGDNQWRGEKRDLTTGLLVSSGFGTADCSGTRDIDITSGSRSAWKLQIEDESTDMGTGDSNSYYPQDHDMNATAAEAAAANIKFSVTAPSNAAVTGEFFAARFFSGSAGTTQLGLRDYSGLTQVTGGFSAIGASATIAIAYTDNLTVAGVLTGGNPGWMTNPEDHIDTVGNEMSLRLRTTADGALGNNSTRVWDFAMVSIQWTETPTIALNEAAYRWFANTDTTDVGSTLANLDTPLAMAPAQGTAFRLRILIHAANSNLAISGQTFKLQIAERGGDNLCDTNFSQESYSDLSPSSGAIRFYDNTPSDGVALTANANDPTHGSPAQTVNNQTYEEANNFTNSQSAINAGEDGKWDFAIVDFSASQDVTYCLRALKSDGTALNSYTVVPEFTTVPENPLILGGLAPFLFALVKRFKKKKAVKK